MSFGREHIMLSQQSIIKYCNNDFISFDKSITVSEAIKIFKKQKSTEGYFIDKDKKFLGKLRLIDIIGVKKNICFMHREKNPLTIDKNSNVNEVIKTLSDFVGESVPIIDKKNNILLGIISENDVLNSYSEISSEIRSIEK